MDIENFAKTYATEKYTSGKYNGTTCNKAKYFACLDAGNFILDEITKILPKNDTMYNDVAKAFLFRLRTRIKELKGIDIELDC